ncbi:MAG: siroheme synthase CysG [Pseudomonadota bacterium]
MDYLPIFLDLRTTRVVVIGGGETALRKIRLLSKCGAQITCVAPQVEDSIRRLDNVEIRDEEYNRDALAGARLVVAATDDQDTNSSVARDARQQGLLVNVVDAPQLCDFIMPSILDRSPVVVAISSGGEAPVLARVLRAKLETLIPQAYGELAAFLGAYRDRIKATITDFGARRRFWEQAVEGSIGELIFAGDHEAAAKELDRHLSDPGSGAQIGDVALVGTGPGDPDLLTFRALRLMQRADLVIYDRLVPDSITDLCRRDARRIYAGKARSEHTLKQSEINALMIAEARKGNRVVRLKGGDPFVFGRGGEEIEGLAGSQIPFQVVPGITAAMGSAAYAGIPLTHRDFADSVLFITGHSSSDGLAIDQRLLTAERQTIAIYMGLDTLSRLCATLIENGISPERPSAIISAGTTDKQRVLESTVAELCDPQASAHMSSPAMIIIGEVVSLRKKLRWFEDTIPGTR